MLRFYRNGEASDPDAFFTGMAAVMADYPVGVLRTVVDPRLGLPSKLKWLPSIAEVKAACETEMVRLAEQSRPALPKPDHAPEVDAAERDRRVKLLTDCAASLRAFTDEKRGADRQPTIMAASPSRAEANLDRLKAEADAGLTITASPSLLQALRERGRIGGEG